MRRFTLRKHCLTHTGNTVRRAKMPSTAEVRCEKCGQTWPGLGFVIKECEVR